MVRDEDVAMAGTSDRGPGMAGRTVRPLVLRRVPSNPAENGPDPSWTDANPEMRDPLISVWWDQPPSDEP